MQKPRDRLGRPSSRLARFEASQKKSILINGVAHPGLPARPRRRAADVTVLHRADRQNTNATVTSQWILHQQQHISDASMIKASHPIGIRVWFPATRQADCEGELMDVQILAK